jgi:hypothetical protein
MEHIGKKLKHLVERSRRLSEILTDSERQGFGTALYGKTKKKTATYELQCISRESPRGTLAPTPLANFEKQPERSLSFPNASSAKPFFS